MRHSIAAASCLPATDRPGFYYSIAVLLSACCGAALMRKPAFGGKNVLTSACTYPCLSVFDLRMTVVFDIGIDIT
jgi:hypothetical protein